MSKTTKKYKSKDKTYPVTAPLVTKYQDKTAKSFDRKPQQKETN